MDELASFGDKRDYESFRRTVPEKILPLFDSLREFCLSLGGNVVEDVRMHRVVFCKSITFRWFADAEPSTDSIIVKIQNDRKSPVQTAEVSDAAGLEDLKDALKKGYLTIH